MAKISIILPIYNVEKYLNRCIDSIVNQTLNDIEIILATDGPIACDKICEEYFKKDNRIKIVYYPGSYGKAFNKSLEIAIGEYIGIVETDDWCDKAMFKKMYDRAKKTNADVVKVGFYYAYDDENKNNMKSYDQFNPILNLAQEEKFIAEIPSVWSCIYKKDFLLKNNIKMIEERMSFIDVPFHYETLYKAEKYILLNEPLYYYYQNNANQSVRHIPPLDGLNSEIFAYNKIKDSDIFKKYEQGFILAIAKHLYWNYYNMSFKNKRIFYKEASKFVNNLVLTKVNCRFLSDKELKLLLYLKKNNFIAMYTLHLIKQLSLSIKKLIKFIFSIKNQRKEQGIYKVITIFGLKIKYLYKKLPVNADDIVFNYSVTIPDNPLVSVIMPTYNAEKYIREAINSILDQSYSNLEFLIIDDNSSDNTLDIIKSYQDKRVKLIRGDNKGLAAALNKGIFQSKGKYIARMDSDDISLPDRIKKQVCFLYNNQDVGIVGTRAATINDSGDLNKHDFLEDFYKYKPKIFEIGILDILNTCALCHPTVMFNKEILKKNDLYYDSNIKFGEDQELWTRAILKTRLAILNESLLKYRIHSNNSTKNECDLVGGGGWICNKSKIKVIAKDISI